MQFLDLDDANQISHVHALFRSILTGRAVRNQAHLLQASMPNLPPSSEIADPPTKQLWSKKYLPVELPDDPIHPAQIALRTYAVSLSLSLGPSLLPFILSLVTDRSRAKIRAGRFLNVLKRELGPNGFAFAITVAVGGGAALQRLWQLLEDSSGNDRIQDTDLLSSAFSSPVADTPMSLNVLERNQAYRSLRSWISKQDVSPSRKSFITNLITSTIAIILLQGKGGRARRPVAKTSMDIPLTMPIDVNTTKYGPSPTLDLTLLLLVRAVDATIQSLVFKTSETFWPRSETLGSIDIVGANGEMLVSRGGAAKADRKKLEETKWRQKVTTHIDSFIFWACSARSVL